MAVLKYYDTTTSSWQYIAASTTANFTTWKKTMSGGETSVSGSDDSSVTLSYTVGLEQVFINGALQARGSDYVATTGTSVTSLTALSVNDIVTVVCYAPFNVADTYTQAQTSSIAAAAAGLRMVVPTSVSVGSGSGSVDANGAVTFSGASSVSLNGCFSANYDSYQIITQTTGSTTTTPLNLRMRASGSDLTTGLCKYAAIYMINSSSTVNGDSGTAATSMTVSNVFNTNRESNFINLTNPFNAQTTVMTVSGNGAEYLLLKNGYVNNTTSYDGITIYPSTGTITGTIRVYGYKN